MKTKKIMETKQLQLVALEQAKRLKALGFDWKCDRYYFEDDQGTSSYILNHNRYDDFYSAPTVALALKWIRDEKTNLFEVTHTDAGEWYYRKRIAQWSEASECIFDTYEAAESALLDELLTILGK
jgi:hypothetical protein